jgi:shikimate kinase
MKLILIGYRAAGKTTIGRLLAEKIGLPFIDTDKLIENEAGMPLADVIQEEGWPGFRKRETKAVMSLDDKGVCVVATGGGVVLSQANTDMLKKEGMLIYLKAEPGDIIERLKKDEQKEGARPRLTDAGLESETQAMLKQRIPLYEALADYTAQTEGKSPLQVVDDIYVHLVETGIVAQINKLKKTNG